jgi:hypothetical protein
MFAIVPFQVIDQSGQHPGDLCIQVIQVRPFGFGDVLAIARYGQLITHFGARTLGGE